MSDLLTRVGEPEIIGKGLKTAADTKKARLKYQHAKLKDAALEAARTWHDNDKGFTRIALRFAVQALMEFEEKHGLTK